MRPRLTATLLGLALFGAGGALLWPTLPGGATGQCGTAPDSISHGPRIGAVDTNSAKIWVRACEQVDVSVQYKTSVQDWASALETAPVPVAASADGTAVATVTGLTAATAYDYRMLVNGQLPTKSPGGSFRTAAPPGGSQVTLTVATDMHYPYQPMPAIINTMNSRDADLSVWLGDHMVIEVAISQLFGYCCIPQAQAHYEAAYRDMFSYSAFADFIANTPTLFTWDDHEIANDWDQGSANPYPLARAAFDEYLGSANPAPRVPGTLYGTQRWGDVEFYLLDTRSYRSPGEMPDGPQKTMLGTEQKQDLKDWLLTSDARFKLIISSVMWNDFSGHVTYGESWPVYATERNEIFDFIVDNQVPGVVLFSGDEHWAGVFRMSPWGIYEVAPGPLGTKVGAAAQSDPQILYSLGWTRIFGLLEADTKACPATLTIKFIDENNNVRYALPLTEMDLGADSDEDTLPPCQETALGTDPFNADTDGDGCPDPDEIGPDVSKGGQRNPTNPWDYFNPTGDGENRIDDVIAVVEQFFVDVGDPNYTEATDRSLVGPLPWNLGPPDGSQNVLDIIASIKQFFHDCP